MIRHLRAMLLVTVLAAEDTDMTRLMILMIAAGAGVVSLVGAGAAVLALNVSAGTRDESSTQVVADLAAHAQHDAAHAVDEPAGDPAMQDDVMVPSHAHEDPPVHDAAAASNAAANAAHPHDDTMATPGAESGSTRPAPQQHHAAVHATPEEVACGNDLVRRAQEATARLADFDVAVAEGYRSNPAKPEATHFANPAYQRDGEVLDLGHPEALVYYTNPRTGEKALLGALFKMPRGQAGPQPCGAVTYWHSHAACTNRDTGDVIPVEHGETCAEGYRYGESVQMMHVWFVPGRKNGVAPMI